MAWWSNNNLRLIQNNLRESDANLDVDLLMGQLNELSANVLMMNAGGIVAFYPTKLEYHYRATGQQKDLLREAIDKAHDHGMKFIARFDFSKAHESILARKPEWFYRTKEGKGVNYFGIAHTCLNGYYQREYSLQIINEVISNYEVDGIFFNMFGYITRDYSGNDYGLCHCSNCRERFRELYHLELPEKADPSDPVYKQHKLFQEQTTREMLDRIHDLVKSKNKDIAISTYNEHKVDIVRKESNTDKARPHPVWLYSASENVKSLEDSWDDKLISNCCINAVDLVHRFTAVSKHEIAIRLKESLASGSGLDFCIIGVFDDYPDRENLPVVAEIFQYHKENEAYYGNFQSVSEVALIKPRSTVQSDAKEYFGLFKMLKEEHVLFDVIHQNTLVQSRERLSRYKVVLIPDIIGFTDEELNVLEQLSREGRCLFSTGRSFTLDDANRAFMERIFGASWVETHHFYREAAYLQTGDKQVFKSFGQRDWLLLDGSFCRVRYAENMTRHLPLVVPSTFGPPERAYGHSVSTEWFGAGIGAGGQHGSGTTVHLPWQPGRLYYMFGYADNKRVITDLLDQIVSYRSHVTTNAPQTVELFYNKIDEQTYILHLLNVSGFNGVTYFEPVPVHDITVTLPQIKECKHVASLIRGQSIFSTMDEHGLTLEVPQLSDFTAILLKTI
ncbi:alpha-amylase family protein [Paenibacillus thalictri]|uniref:Beta-galactosidase trimerisation domain-containing protein n=1 Tax=Paenibacillus thalictri TaxID=2527873 RepID=A0A4Q9DR85_9BACL|nr:alpha-amylase family protein [Paenibacillus thalictri]TBL79119.1 hypothetical protein EYB31_12945 [Paenibacillus thalictri]